jgi:HSP20 family protein
LDVLKGKVARELAALEEDFERLLERAFHTGVQLPGRSDRFRPAMDVFEAEDAFVVQVDLAGVRPDDLRLVVDGEYLQISGSREPSPGRSTRRHLQMEIPWGRFERVARVRAPFDADRVTAQLEAGVLTVRLPRVQPLLRSIRVESK